MDPITSAVFFVTIAAVCFYVTYWVVRKAVAAGIADARGSRDTPSEDAAPSATKHPNT